MGKRAVSQEGFELVIVAAVIVVVAVLGASGWLVYRDHYKTRSAAADSTTTTTQPSTTQPAPSKPAQPATAYLTVSEWGVSFPLSSSIQEAYYVVPLGASNNGIDGKPSNIFVSDHSLDSACGGTLTASGDGASDGLGDIMRVQPNTIDPLAPGGADETYAQVHPGGATIDGWYYVFTGPNDACANTSATASAAAAFKSATSTAVSSSSATSAQ